MNDLKTKIICTIGPASGTADIIRKLILNGMNVARLNFSHGRHDEHLEKINLIREISGKLNKPVAILQDLQGPKIRVGDIPSPGILLKSGQTFSLTVDDIPAGTDTVGVSHKNLPQEVKPGDRILMADGLLELAVNRIEFSTIRCTVITGGILTSHKGINLPTSSVQTSSMTDKDLEDLEFGLAQDVDYVALSFVRTAEDILSIKQVIAEKGKTTPVIAKIEKHEALDHIDEIMAVSEAIMVARGDLGVEIPLEQVPGIQKQLIEKSNSWGKPVIIATQMLRSMVDSPRPTRAEASDVANAVLDGADAVMLSEETAMGSYPLEALQYMVRIARHAEQGFPHDKYLKIRPNPEISESVAYAACVLADHLDAGAIIAATQSGFTAQQISKFRPKVRLLAVSPDPVTLRRLALCWGCIPTLADKRESTDAMIHEAASTALETGMVSKGDNVVITAGWPLWVTGTTNMIQVRTV